MTSLGDRRLTRLQGAVSGDPELTAVLQAARSDIRWAWFHRLRYRLSDRHQWRHWWTMKRIALARKWSEWRDRWWLFRNRNRLRSGEAIGPLVELCHEATNNESRFAPSNWNAWLKNAVHGSPKQSRRVASGHGAIILRRSRTREPTRARLMGV